MKLTRFFFLKYCFTVSDFSIFDLKINIFNGNNGNMYKYFNFNLDLLNIIIILYTQWVLRFLNIFLLISILSYYAITFIILVIFLLLLLFIYLFLFIWSLYITHSVCFVHFYFFQKNLFSDKNIKCWKQIEFLFLFFYQIECVGKRILSFPFFYQNTHAVYKNRKFS